MGRSALGELEHLLLVSIVRLRDDAYGAKVIEEVESQTSREVSHAAAYIALQRLERKDMIAGRDQAPAPGRGGRSRRFFTVTDTGLQRLHDSANALFEMWHGVDPALRGGGDQ